MISRFKLGCFITCKKPEIVIDQVMQSWLGAGIESSKKFLVNNGYELENAKFSSLCENLNIHLLNTAEWPV